MKEKVFVLRELQRAIIYTSTLSKQAIEGHVRTVYIAYLVSEGARLTLHKHFPHRYTSEIRYVNRLHL